MRIKHLRQADLNLLIVFTVLAEERNVTRAAARLLLSQPAVSRALQRLRDMFHDDLLIRTSSGYQPTPKGDRLLRELESTLPRLDRLLSGKDFDPAAEETSFRIGTTDHACHVLCPLLCRTVLAPAGKVSFHFMPLHDGTFEAMEKGRIDLVLTKWRRRLRSRAPGERGHFRGGVYLCRGQGKPLLACFHTEAVSRCRSHRNRDSGRNSDHPGEEISRNRGPAPLPDVGAVSYGRDAQRRRHKSGRDGTQAHGGIGGFESGNKNPQSAGLTLRIQVSDGLASPNEYSPGTPLVPFD